MNLSRTAKLLAAAASLAGLAVPAAASAHPGVYSVTAKVAGASTYATDPTGTTLTDQTQYAIANDGYPLGLVESNGVTGVQPDGTAGMINYKRMPGTWRAPMTAEQKRTYAGAQTDVQPHATCNGASSAALGGLNSGANVLAWQSADPFYDYIPWQRASVGLGDDPATWIPVVRAATGVDLGAIPTVDATKTVNDAINTAPFKTACEGIGGTYHKADTASNIATALIADTKAPLQAQITTLTDQVTALQNDVTTLGAAKTAAQQAAASADAAKATAQAGQAAADAAKIAAQSAAAKADAERQALADRPLQLALAAKTFAGGSGVAQATGRSGASVKVTVALTASAAKKLGVSSRSVSSRTTSLGSQGAALVSLAPSRAVTRALKRKTGRFAVVVTATADGRTKTASASLTR